MKTLLLVLASAALLSCGTNGMGGGVGFNSVQGAYTTPTTDEDFLKWFTQSAKYYDVNFPDNYVTSVRPFWGGSNLILDFVGNSNFVYQNYVGTSPQPDYSSAVTRAPAVACSWSSFGTNVSTTFTHISAPEVLKYFPANNIFFVSSYFMGTIAKKALPRKDCPTATGYGDTRTSMWIRIDSSTCFTATNDINDLLSPANFNSITFAEATQYYGLNKVVSLTHDTSLYGTFCRQ